LAALNRASCWRAALRVVLVAPVGLGCLVWLREIGGPAALSARLGLWAPPLSVALHVAIEMTPFGNVIPFGVANGSIYGVWIGALLSWLGWMVAALLQHALVQSGHRQPADGAAPPRRPAWLARLPIEHPAVLIVGRWLPGGAYFVNLGASALGVSLTRQLACAAIASAPAALALAALGSQLAG
jgi:uncharacterized membrane protein YdjX (TVP38/TMEM64 family)